MRKAMLRLGPFLGLLYLIAYVDRNNAGFAKLEMSRALGITESAFGLAAGIFFVGYFLFEVPSNLALHRFGARTWIARIMLTWGVVAVATAFVTGDTGFTVARFLLGVAEAGFFPGVLLYLTFWFPRRYRTRVLAIFAVSNPLANAVSAPVSGWILGLSGLFGLAGWQLVFVLEGVPALVLAVVTWRVLPDRPADARWLDPAERDWIDRELAADAAGAERAHGRLRLADAFRNGRLWALIFVFFGVVFGSYGMGLWLPTIVADMGDWSTGVTGLLVAIPNLVAAAVMLPWEWYARRRGNIPRQVALTLLVTALALVAAVAARGIPVVSLAAICVGMAALFSTTPLFWSLPSTFLTGVAAAAGLAFVNSVGNLAGFAGPYAIGWVSQATGTPVWGLLLVSALTLGGAAVALALSRRSGWTPATAETESVASP
jgi:sugar phosphate permease